MRGSVSKNKRPGEIRGRSYLLEELEPRTLFSADPLVGLLDSDASSDMQSTPAEYLDVALLESSSPVASQAEYALPTSKESPDTPELEVTKELVFVDTGVEGHEQLLADLLEQAGEPRQFIVHTLDSQSDGIAQISAILAEQTEVDAVHIVSHGSEGSISLGNSGLNSANLDDYSDAISGWTAAFTDDTDILIYGCDLAGNFAGQSLTTALSEITGADVAASDDDTGQADLGGDWDLEYQVGQIETTVAFSADAQENWQGLLAAEFRVNNSAAGPQETSAENRGSQQAVSLAADGSYVVTWTDDAGGFGKGIYARRFDASGTPITGDILVNQAIPDDQQWARVASDAAGNFVVTWTSSNQDGTPQSVYARRFDAGGSALTNEFQVNATASGTQKDSVIAMDQATGDFVIAWQGEGPGDTAGIFFRRFNADGTAKGTVDQLANLTDRGIENDPAIAMQASGGFVIVWEEGKHLYFQRFDSTGGTQNSEVQIDGGLSTSSGASVASDSAGNFTVVYREESILTGIWRIGFNADGTEKYGWSQLATGDAISPSIDMADDGSHIVTYQKTGNGFDVFAKKFDTNGNSLGGAFQVNQTSAGSQSQASIALIDTDNYVITWTDDSTGQTDVYARQFGTASTNNAPNADAGSPYVINEGGSVILDASSSSDPDGDSLSYAWDLDNDGNYDDATGAVQTLDWSTLQGFGIDDNGVYTIGLQVDDGNGGIDTTTTTITVNNVAPTLSITGAATVSSGGVYTLNLSAVDSGNDTITSWTINWGDGTIETIAGNPSTATHTYTNIGFTYNILASVTDEDGTFLQNELLVTSFNRDSVFRFAATTGAFMDEFAMSQGINDPIDAVIGPDGNLYVSSEISNDVLRFNAATGAFIDTFIPAGTAGMNNAGGLVFGPDGNLYVADYGGDKVLRFDGTTGTYIDDFVIAGSGGLGTPYGLEFGPDGNLYVNSYANHNVLRFDGVTGAFIDEFVAAGLGGLNKPEQMTFGPDGNLYVTSFSTNNVLRYDGLTGAFIDEFIAAGSGGLDKPAGLAFGPDGNLYVADHQDGLILRYDGNDGTFMDEYVSAGAGGLTKPNFISFVPGQQVTVTNQPPTTTGISNVMVDEDASNTTVNLFAAFADVEDSDANLTYTIQSNTNTGLFTSTTIDGVAGNLTLNYAPDQNGSADLTIRATDTGGLFVETTFAVTVNAVNDVPLATGNTVIANEDVPLVISAGDFSFTDTEGDSLASVTITGLTLNGGTLTHSGGTVTVIDGMTVTVAQLADLTFASALNDSTNSSFTYTVNDTGVGVTSAVMNITVNAVNDVPVALGNTVIAIEDVPLVIGASDFNFSDIENNSLVSVTIAGLNLNGGTLTHTGGSVNVSNGMTIAAAQLADLTFTSALNDSTDSSFTYIVNDAGTGITSAVMNITVNGANDVPVATGNTVIANEDIPLVISAGDFNFTDTEGDSLASVTITGLNLNGGTLTHSAGAVTVIDGMTVTAAQLADLTFTSALNDSSNSSFTYTVNDTGAGVTSAVMNITVNAVNDIPVATGNTVIANEDSPFVIGASDFNFNDVESHALASIKITGLNLNGGTLTHTSGTVNVSNGMTVTAAQLADLTFTSAPNDSTNSSFTYTVNDADAGVESAVMNITVNAVNDIPVATGNTVIADEDIPLVIGVSDFNFTDVENDALASITITGLNLNGGTLTHSGGAVIVINGMTVMAAELADLTFTTALNNSTDSSFTYTVNDAGTGVTASIMNITVNAVNNAPTDIMLSNSTVTENINSGGGLSVGTLTSVDPDTGDSAAYSIVGGADQAKFTIGGTNSDELILTDGLLDHEIQAVYDVRVSVQDSGGQSYQENLIINVSDLNDLPVITSSNSPNVDENTSTVINVIATDQDVPVQNLSYAISGGVDAGLFSVDGNTGLLVFDFSPDFENPSDLDNDNLYKVDVSVDDGNGGLATQNLVVRVVDVNDAPQLSDGVLSLNKSSSAGTLLGNSKATDQDTGDTLSYSILADSSGGALAVNANGDLVVTDDALLNSQVTNEITVTLQVTDNAGLTDTATITVQLTSASFAASSSDTALGPVFAAESSIEESIESNLDEVEEIEKIQQEVANEALAEESKLSSDAANLGNGIQLNQTTQESTRDSETEASLYAGYDKKNINAKRGGIQDRLGTVTLKEVDIFGLVDTQDPESIASDSNFRKELNRMRQEVKEDAMLEKSVVGSSVAVTTGLSVGYVMWLVRGGVLLSSVLSSLPAWRMIDPLPVLGRMNDRLDDDTDDRDSLDALVRKGAAAVKLKAQLAKTRLAQNMKDTGSPTTVSE